MLFTVGVEYPKNDNEAYGMIVPALFNEQYSCFSAADSVEQIPEMVKDAITMILADMLENGFDVMSIQDNGFIEYQKVGDFDHIDTWLLIDVDVSEYMGKKQRINISLPSYLINRIDTKVGASGGRYRDRSHFLAVASQHELSASS
ncbi:CopG family transcriptional regulator [Testudinibacter sp. TR-2022]|uniref:type II toxin-antitoxin system HicB family antitoxin n=1 Tax=Testudinibacter sp. TR-2022 TaxID=2585029 RepID=UPI001118BE5D|nr:type II toxin-antitoxin system HicB family antitoxin [Testudinibacter sp. TR-2022]TNH03141.1 CopG family transcriptional regulator [Pasteurellaceae bacterium Phil31]TNH09470.1 CopG family transcriptional regulator [Pasteurellaceae bacterium Phil11]TNH10863.1 CopG family transcriptional regulator [Testudinibacter sp. TR-2022]TNH12234.1 CopG family transcriptional regulator [Testudinibacter sp. TR-2022]TNH15350.1 CopG family transcriptional regulator [Testudinibacter sp. TR-2022]